MAVTNMKINGITTPLGYEPGPLLLSWHTQSSAKKQAEAWVRVLDERNALVWETRGDLNWEGTSLEFTPLPRTRYRVDVQITDESGCVERGSTWFETGKLDEPWQAEWIGTAEETEWAPVLSGEFDAVGEITSARLYVVGLGVYTAALNGQPVSDEILAPGMWYYEEETQYQTYDVTHLLREKNTLEVTLGNGWYKGQYGLDRTTFGSRYALLAELHIRFADGTTQVFFTDESWLRRESDISSNNGIYDGESLDRLSHTGKENPLQAVVSPSRSMLKPQLLVNGCEAAAGYLSLTAPRCPHLGCALKWNPAEYSWDCPCHGSRFDRRGGLLDNPSAKDLHNKKDGHHG